LLDHPCATAAERRPDRKLVPSRGAARDEEVGDVDAGQEQEEAHCTHQGLKCPFYIVDQPVA
jgi:hypothetical protein